MLVLKDSPRLLLLPSFHIEWLYSHAIPSNIHCPTEKGLTERTDRMEVEKDKDLTLDTLEVLLNPGLIKTKACLTSRLHYNQKKSLHSTTSLLHVVGHTKRLHNNNPIRSLSYFYPHSYQVSHALSRTIRAGGYYRIFSPSCVSERQPLLCQSRSPTTDRMTVSAAPVTTSKQCDSRNAKVQDRLETLLSWTFCLDGVIYYITLLRLTRNLLSFLRHAPCTSVQSILPGRAITGRHFPTSASTKPTMFAHCNDALLPVSTLT